MFGLCVLLSMRRQQNPTGAGESSTGSLQRALVLLPFRFLRNQIILCMLFRFGNTVRSCADPNLS